MPYISTEQVKAVRVALKKEFPNVKFSVTRENCTNLHICIMEHNIEFTAIDRYNGQKYDATNLNHYYIEETFAHNESAKEFLSKVLDVISSVHPEEIITEDADYGSIPNYYLNMRIGKWDRPYVLRKAA